MEPITGLDATFLYGETYNSPMHVGSIAVIEGSLQFADFKAVLQSKIHLIPKLRQRLVNVPLNLGYPYWADDPNFDLDLHLERVALPQPGSWRELREVASNVFSKPLDRSRPLWAFTFVEGLDNIPQVPKGSVAIVSRMHHVAIDGMAGTGMMALLFDFSPKAKKPKPPVPYKPKPLPDTLSILYNNTVSWLSAPLKVPQLLSDTVGAGIKLGFLNQAQRMDLPVAPFSAPPSPLNGIISARRKWNSALLSFERIKTLKNIMDVTFNDVVLTICGGALRRYLNEKKQLPLKPLVAMVPVSTRSQADINKAGNQVSSMLIQLATNIEDPIERLEKINENTVKGKVSQEAIGAKTLAKMAEAVPFGLANQAAKLYSQYQMAEMHNPAFNVTITNVPGPQMPLFLNGHKLLSVMGMAPIIDGMGLIITIFSYNGLVSISPTSDAKTMPDIDNFTRYIREEANNLEALILARSEREKQPEVQAEQKAEIAVFLEKMQAHLPNIPKSITGKKATFHLHIEGENENVDWQIQLNGEPQAQPEAPKDAADLKISMPEKYFLKLAQGKLQLSIAQIQGRLQAVGDLSKIALLEDIIQRSIKQE